MIENKDFNNNWAQFKTQLANLFNNIIISKSNIKSPQIITAKSTVYEGYPCLGMIPMQGITENYFPIVSFTKEAIDTGCFYEAIIESRKDYVYIYMTDALPNDFDTGVNLINRIVCLNQALENTTATTEVAE